jgi:hypothetical protein
MNLAAYLFSSCSFNFASLVLKAATSAALAAASEASYALPLLLITSESSSI